MLLRLRSRDGLERVKVADDATVADLRQAIAADLSIPVDDFVISQEPTLLTAKDGESVQTLSALSKSLKGLGIQHGDTLFMKYGIKRSIPGPPRSTFETRPFGAHMDVRRMVAAQTRIERQETAACSSASFDAEAAHAFQSYVSAALAFSIKRGGILYGVVGEEGAVQVHAIYEPPQSATADSLQLERGTEEEAAADVIATTLGWTKVGWVYSQSVKERDFIDEIGETAVTAMVAAFPGDDGQVEVHVEAFQVSRQCVKLWKEGWFQDQTEPSGVTTLRNPKEPGNATPVIVAGKDQGEVDNDYFLMPVSIKDHVGPLENAFPCENRLLPQGKAELRAHLQKRSGKPFAERLADFHLLLFLARQPNFDLTEVGHLTAAVAAKEPVGEGYELLIESLAGM
ncbi:NPL4-like protein 2 [Auxenochlorella protothecoides]|uniref:NPL4-like protein 2 n=1 Tax=Auxenochlorella protothecoides TaxID=3075 RepID=A0A087SGR7_AUXPR|nr:NPL4-like protein 2 [Auxenochlorella protothecoides]KFM24921.1 NPL4-like protein 2 [Auxenochlorella protothecoides]